LAGLALCHEARNPGIAMAALHPLDSLLAHSRGGGVRRCARAQEAPWPRADLRPRGCR
jgi:hypothetical protein